MKFKDIIIRLNPVFLLKMQLLFSLHTVIFAYRVFQKFQYTQYYTDLEGKKKKKNILSVFVDLWRSILLKAYASNISVFVDLWKVHFVLALCFLYMFTIQYMLFFLQIHWCANLKMCGCCPLSIPFSKSRITSRVIL